LLLFGTKESWQAMGTEQGEHDGQNTNKAEVPCITFEPPTKISTAKGSRTANMMETRLLGAVCKLGSCF
jgi:hypothetical protein